MGEDEVLVNAYDNSAEPTTGKAVFTGYLSISPASNFAFFMALLI